jgi:hypothetical protein
MYMTKRSMNYLIALLLVLVPLSATALEAGETVAEPRLMLWLTESIGATDASQCNLHTTSNIAHPLPAITPAVTEKDVIAWDLNTVLITLDPARFNSGNAIYALQDHCFILAIEGKMVASGVVLSSYSARYIRFPTLRVFNRKEEIDVQLTSDFTGYNSTPILVNKIDAVLGRKN